MTTGWLACLAPLGLAAATTAALAADSAGRERFDAIWSHTQWFEGRDGGFVRSVQFSGRFQLDQAYVDSGDGEHSETNIRRMRAGVKVGFLDHFLLHAEAEYDPSEDPWYRRLTDTYLAWSPSDALEVTAGKHSAPFTMDGMTSSKELVAIDRSALTNNMWFTNEYFTGLSAAGAVDKFDYHLGVYSSGELDRGFGDSNGGEFVLGTVGYDFAELLAARKAVLHFNLVDNEPDVDNTAVPKLERILSVNFDYAATGRWGLRADLSAAEGYFGQSDLHGVMLMPLVNLERDNQLVFRYTYVASNDVNGVRFGLYERALENGRGDHYRELYAGFNHYWYGHKLKLQSGVQYVDMNDAAADGGAYTGWQWVTGIRVSW